MSVFDGQRLPSAIFKLDTQRLPQGWYSDKYFLNIAQLLAISPSAAIPSRETAHQSDIDPSIIHTGDIEVEMQWFTRRQPYTVVAGVDEALAILRENTGYEDADGRFVNTFHRMKVEAVQDGVILPYGGEADQVAPVIRMQGRYRDFAVLETPTLGALTEATRVATNVYEVLTAAKGKDVQFFPARFAHYKLQALHGYAYSLAVQAYNKEMGGNSGLFISTDEQGSWWGALGGGTVAHAAIAAFLGDTAEAMVQFAHHRPPEVPRIALVDFHNDCVGDTLEVMRRMFDLYLKEIDAGDAEDEAAVMYCSASAPTPVPPCATSACRRWAIRNSTWASLPRLVYLLRDAIDGAWKSWELPRRMGRSSTRMVPPGQNRGQRRLRPGADPPVRETKGAGRYLWRRNSLAEQLHPLRNQQRFHGGCRARKAERPMGRHGKSSRRDRVGHNPPASARIIFQSPNSDGSPFRGGAIQYRTLGLGAALHDRILAVAVAGQIDETPSRSGQTAPRLLG